MIGRQRVATLFALFALCCWIGKSQAGLSKGFEELSSFLEENSKIIDAKKNLDLIDTNLKGLGREAKDAVRKLKNLSEIDKCRKRPRVIYAIQRYKDEASSEKMNNLFAYVSAKFYRRCKESLEDKLAPPDFALLKLYSRAKDVLGHDFILNRLTDEDFLKKYREMHPSYFEDFDLKVRVEDDIGPSIYTDSQELLREKIADFLGVKKSVMMDENLKGAERVMRWLAVACVNEVNHSGPQVKFLRALQKVSSLPGQSPVVKLGDFSGKAQDIVFRVKYCEDLLRMSKSKKIIIKLYKMMASSKYTFIDMLMPYVLAGYKLAPFLIVYALIYGTILISG